MAYTRTLLQLRKSLARRLGIAGSSGDTSSEDLTAPVLNEMLNDALMEAYDIQVGKWLDYYTKLSSATPTVAGTDSYALATDFYKLRKVEKLVAGTEYDRMFPGSIDEAHRYSSSRGDPARYILLARNLVFTPVPDKVYTFRYYYIPIRTELVADGDTVTFDVPVEQKLLLSIAARDCMDAQNLDPGPWLQKIDRYSSQLRTTADNRDAGEPFYLDASGPPREYGDEEWWP